MSSYVRLFVSTYFFYYFAGHVPARSSGFVERSSKLFSNFSLGLKIILPQHFVT